MALLRRTVKCLVTWVLFLSCCCGILLLWGASGKSPFSRGNSVPFNFLAVTNAAVDRQKSGNVRFLRGEKAGDGNQARNVEHIEQTARAVTNDTARSRNTAARLQGVGRRQGDLTQHDVKKSADNQAVREGQHGGHRMAVVIPFRDREAHLKEFVKHMVPFLTKQNLSFHIFVIEQSRLGLFNRAKLSNIGFKLAKERGFDYVCFHDVDMLPLNERNLYSYPASNPTHLATCVEQFSYKLPFEWYCGGVILFTMEQFEKINGMGNVYFGWGKEDDDLFRRISTGGFKLERPEPYVGSDCLGRYRSLDHGGRDYSSSRRNNELLSGSRNRQATDGLRNLKFGLESDRTSGTVTRVVVDVCMGVSIVAPEVVKCKATAGHNATR